MEYRAFLENKKKSNHNMGIEVSDINPVLFQFQADIVKWATKKGRASIFAECGLGKTFLQLEWAKQIGGNSLILAPLSVSHQTKRESEKLGINITVCKFQDDCQSGINITNYERLDKFNLSAFDAIVLDESSILKSFTGKIRTAIINSCQSVPYRLACTATPSPNDYMELGNHSEFLGILTRTEMLSMYFVHDGGETQKWRLKGHAEKPFWEWVVSWAVILKKPSDLGYSDDGFILPELNINPVICDGDYKPDGYLFAPASMSLNERRSARKASIQKRVEIAVDIIKKEPHEPWLIWCDLNAEADAFRKAMPDSIEVRGTDTVEEKEKRLVSFLNGKSTYLISKPSIFGFGLNLQHCARMIFLGLSDSWESYYQAIRRCWRFGQKRAVKVYPIISQPETVVLENIKMKEAQHLKMNSEMIKHTSQITKAEIHGTQKGSIKYQEDVAQGKGWICYQGDCIEVLKNRPDISIDFSIFSPPFSSLYTYSADDRDMGNCISDEEFFKHMGFLIKELFRVTKPGRIVAFHCMNLPTSKERDGYIGIKDFRGELIRAFEKRGFIYHSEVCIWKNPVTAMQRTKAIGLLYKQLKKDSTISRQGIPDYVIAVRKPGENKSPVTKNPDDFPVSKWQNWASPIWMDINPSETLQRVSAREERDERHIAPLQLEVIRRCIYLWSNPGDLILSPFAGIGSEGYEAIKSGRQFIGIELKRSYWKQACLNLEIAETTNKGLFG